MLPKKWKVNLSTAERMMLKDTVNKGILSAKIVKRANIMMALVETHLELIQHAICIKSFGGKQPFSNSQNKEWLNSNSSKEIKDFRVPYKLDTTDSTSVMMIPEHPLRQF